MPTRFRKTAKGQTEIETRAHRLAPRLRALLIMVDGKRGRTELSALMPPSADAALDELLAQGFVEAVETGSTGPAGAPAPAGVAARPPAAASEPAPNLDQLRREAVRALTDIAGPAAESLALRMEKAGNAEELRTLVMLAAKTVAQIRGRAAAEAYAARFLQP